VSGTDGLEEVVWRTVPATEVKPGDVVELPDGKVVNVTRIESLFGRTDFLKLIEDNDERWMASGMPTAIDVKVKRSS
jgi:hypothetical protein